MNVSGVVRGAKLWHSEGMTRASFSLLALFCLVPAHAAEADALRLTATLRQRHAPFGALMDPVFASPDSDEIVAYSRCGDSALWTGHFLAAESYRWAVTKSPAALDNVQSALHGIRTLIDVTGNDTLARCAFPENFAYASGIMSEERANGVYQGLVDGAKWTWIGNTSRDQYLGVFFGLTAAWNLVDHPTVKPAVAWLSARLVKKLQANAWVVRGPDGASTTFLLRADQILMLLKLARRANPGHFDTSYRLTSYSYAPQAIAAVAFDVADPYESYFKFNLNHITYYGLLTSGDNSWVRSNYEKAYEILRNTTDDHQNAFFDVIDHAIQGPNPARDQRIAALLEAWLRRPRRDPWVDRRLEVPQCGDRACSPLPVELRVTTDFVWQRSPFQVRGGGYGTIEGAGVDYTLPYWMARYHRVVTD
jgi:hypothetical protein